MRRNPEMPGVWAGAGLAAAGLTLILLPPAAGLDMMAYGFAMQFLGLFLAIAGLVVAAIFGARARKLSGILAGRNLLAHWVYSTEDLRGQAERDFRQTRQRNTVLFLVVLGWMALFVALFVVIGFREGNEEGLPLFVGIMAGVLLLVGAFAAGMPYAGRRRALKSGSEAYIAADALFANGVLHTWTPPLAGLSGVSLVEDSDPARLVFRLRSLSKANVTLYQSYSVEVPVPPGEIATARRIEQHFRGAPPAIG